VTALSDKIAGKVGTAFTKLALSGSVQTGVGTGSPVTTAALLVGPVNDIERYTATGAATMGAATFYVQASGLPAVPRNGDKVIFDSKNYQIAEVSKDGVQGVDLVYTLDVTEIGNA
jgi:hypothetical protein